MLRWARGFQTTQLLVASLRSTCYPARGRREKTRRFNAIERPLHHLGKEAQTQW